MTPRIAIIGSCVTRDVWNLEGFSEDSQRELLFLARTSLASLFAQPHPALTEAETPSPQLSKWESRMVADDVLKTGMTKLLQFQPTHLILDMIDERFDLLKRDGVVVTHSWELHTTGLDRGPLSDLKRVHRDSKTAATLWRRGLETLAAFLKAKLPKTRVIFHDARWALDYLDTEGVRQPFAPDRELWPGVPANIQRHNEILASYAVEVRSVLPQAFYIRTADALSVADETHRWGLSPFHYTEAYYRQVWFRLLQLGCGAPGTPTA